MQLQSSVQQAVAVVRQYPFAVDINQLLEGLAHEAKEPEPVKLMQPSGLDYLQHAANWEVVLQYVENIDASGLHHHVPFVQL